MACGLYRNAVPVLTNRFTQEVLRLHRMYCPAAYYMADRPTDPSDRPSAINKFQRRNEFSRWRGA
jgi:hypothetical protein